MRGLLQMSASGLCAWLWVLTLLPGCGAFPFSPHEVRLDETQRDLTRKNLAKVNAREWSLPLRIGIIGDIQIWQTEVRDAVRALQSRTDIDLVFQMGDITEFGLAEEFRWTQGHLAGLPQPFFTVIGNHDLLSNGRDLYGAMYGPTNYSFIAARMKFIFLDNNSREYAFDGQVPDLDFLRLQLAKDPSFDRAVVITHIPPWDGDSDPALEDLFADLLREARVPLSLHGHLHEFLDEDHYGDGVRYVVADSMKPRTFLIVVIDSSQITVERVPF